MYPDYVSEKDRKPFSQQAVKPSTGRLVPSIPVKKNFTGSRGMAHFFGVDRKKQSRVTSTTGNITSNGKMQTGHVKINDINIETCANGKSLDDMYTGKLCMDVCSQDTGNDMEVVILSDIAVPISEVTTTTGKRQCFSSD